MTTGFTWAVCAALMHHRLDREEESRAAHRDLKEWDEIEGRLDRIERAIDLVAAKSETSDFVTRGELTEKLEDLKCRMDQDVEARFECQSLSVEALRTMIRHTDSLLERVLGALGEAQKKEDQIDPVAISAG